MAACLHQTSRSKHQTFPGRRLCVYGTRAPSRKRLYLSIVGRNMMINVIAASSLREEFECHECTNKHHESKITKSNSGTRLAGCNYAGGSGSTFGFKSSYSPERVGRQSCCGQNKPAQAARTGQHTCCFCDLERRTSNRFHRALGGFSRCDGSRKNGSSFPPLYRIGIDFAHQCERRDENCPRLHL